MLLFYLKKLAARLLFPIPLLLLIAIAGGVLLLLSRRFADNKRKKKIMRICGISAVVLSFLILLAGALFGSVLLRCYSAGSGSLDVREFSSGRLPLIIGVTSAGISTADGVEVAERLIMPDSRARIDEGARLYRECEKAGIPCKMAISLPYCEKDCSCRQQEAILSALKRYHIDPDEVVIMQGVLNSRDEIKSFLEIPGRLIVVSRASHLPRLLDLTRRYGAEDALASSYDLPLPPDFNPLMLIPSAESLRDFEIMIYELLGRAEIMLNGLFCRQQY